MTTDKREDLARILQRMTFATLRRGKSTGLSKDEVKVLEEALTALGWLPAREGPAR